MLRALKVAAAVVIALAGTVFIASELVHMYWLRSVVAAGNAAWLNTDAAALDRELRQALPVGTSRAAVEEALRSRRIAFSFEESSGTLYAGVRDLKGSNEIVERALSLQFHFDQSLSLTEIVSKAVYTGH
jgi:hypothetical protein